MVKDLVTDHNLMNPLQKLFVNWSGKEAASIELLPFSGSYRKYFRMQRHDVKALGVINHDYKENQAFISFSKHFKQHGLNVPDIYASDLENDCYLIQDLGDTTLYSKISQLKPETRFNDETIGFYKKALEILPKFQIDAGNNIDYTLCFPRDAFDEQSMQWDLNYFKYYFLKLAKVEFNEQDLENDFKLLIDFLLKSKRDYFLYRDFQSRNIMIFNDDLFFIDYQGGRRGALQYDLMSLLLDGKAAIPGSLRKEFIQFYHENISLNYHINIEEFDTYLGAYGLIRIMQAMGAYGFRGFYEKKSHFLQSIPYAINNLHWLKSNYPLPVQLPALENILEQICNTESLQFKNHIPTHLKVTINSFSYKDQIPTDNSGNGGGFVFDCRALPNPGRYDEYMSFTGKDNKVIKFLEKEEAVHEFLGNTFQIIDQAVNNYISREFTHLMVSFGCTGGQHRSVYCAEKLSNHLKEKFNIQLSLNHNMLNK
ncbi:phosphotransferase [candidate division KSB1 bacterium]